MANGKWLASPAGGQTAVYLLIACIILSGCMTAKKVVRERVDQEVAGNQGVIYGSVPPPTRPAKTTREYIQVDVDLDEMFAKTQKPSEVKPAASTSAAPAASTCAPYRVPSSSAKPVCAPALQASAPAVTSLTYTVKPDQSLSRIAKEVYGDGSKWNIIYEANKEKIKDPNKIKAGLTLVIPQLGTAKKAEK